MTILQVVKRAIARSSYLGICESYEGRLYSDAPLIIGGIEASLRRFGHYGLLVDNCASSPIFSWIQRLMYSFNGMGELQIVELADALDQGRFKESLALFVVFVIWPRKTPTIDYVEGPSLRKLKRIRWLLLMHSVCSMMNKHPFLWSYSSTKHGDRYLVQNTPCNCHLRRRKWMRYITCRILASGILNMMIRVAYQH